MQVGCGTAFTPGRAVASQRAFLASRPMWMRSPLAAHRPLICFFFCFVAVGQTFVRSPLATIKGHHNVIVALGLMWMRLPLVYGSHDYLFIPFLLSCG